MKLKIKTFFLLIFLIFSVASSGNIYSQEKNIIKSSSPATIRKVDYSLADPGLLPDNKFYKLKLLRDKIIRLIINDPVKKIEYDLLLADKTINASKILTEKGNIPLAKETVLKGENYFTELVTDYKWAFWKGNQIPKKLDERIQNASLKHKQVMEEMLASVKAEDKKVFQDVLYFSKINDQELVNLKLKK